MHKCVMQCEVCWQFWCRSHMQNCLVIVLAVAIVLFRSSSSSSPPRSWSAHLNLLFILTSLWSVLNSVRILSLSCLFSKPDTHFHGSEFVCLLYLVKCRCCDKNTSILNFLFACKHCVSHSLPFVSCCSVARNNAASKEMGCPETLKPFPQEAFSCQEKIYIALLNQVSNTKYVQ